MTIAATILIPTFDHGPLLRRALAAVRGQSVREIEIFIVGDGVPDITRELVAEAAAVDPRIRFFDNPKGERHGEAHRHAALEAASGRIVCFVCDDDLLLPHHVRTMHDLLESADLAHTLPAQVEPEGRLATWPVDWRLAVFRDELFAGTNRVPGSNVAFTLAAYRDLPVGWSPAPRHVATDVFMWRKFLAREGLRIAASAFPTVLHFPSPLRTTMTTAEREAELDAWLPRVQHADEVARIEREILAQQVRHAAEVFAQHAQAREQIRISGREIARLEHTIARAKQALDAPAIGTVDERPIDLGELARFPTHAAAGSVVGIENGELKLAIVADDFYFDVPAPFFAPPDAEFRALRLTVAGHVGAHFSLYARPKSLPFSEDWVTHARYIPNESPSVIELPMPVAPEGGRPARFRLDCFNGANAAGAARILDAVAVVVPYA